MFPDPSRTRSTGFNHAVPKTLETPRGVILVTLLSALFTVYTFPDSSTTISDGWLPVVPRVLETPRGVILVTVLSLWFTV